MRLMLMIAIFGLAACSAEQPAENAHKNDAPQIAEQPSFSSPVATPSAQDELFAYLEGKAAGALECPNMPADFEFCNPQPVTATDNEARRALSYMINFDELMAPCVARDAESCFKQQDYRALAAKMGWCPKTAMGRDGAENVLWARCGDRGIIIVNEAQ